MQIYHGEFESRENVEKEFNIKIPDRYEIIFAAYEGECYEGDAFVLYKEDNKLFEVDGGHCSCYGLENQWSPEETSLEALEVMLKNRTYGVTGRYKEVILDNAKQSMKV